MLIAITTTQHTTLWIDPDMVDIIEPKIGYCKIWIRGETRDIAGSAAELAKKINSVTDDHEREFNWLFDEVLTLEQRDQYMNHQF